MAEIATRKFRHSAIIPKLLFMQTKTELYNSLGKKSQLIYKVFLSQFSCLMPLKQSKPNIIHAINKIKGGIGNVVILLKNNIFDILYFFDAFTDLSVFKTSIC